jgi:hypothetical protein
MRLPGVFDCLNHSDQDFLNHCGYRQYNVVARVLNGSGIRETVSVCSSTRVEVHEDQSIAGREAQAGDIRQHQPACRNGRWYSGVAT